MNTPILRSAAAVAAASVFLAACGSDDAATGADAAGADATVESSSETPAEAGSTTDDSADAVESDVPTIVVTTNILGDVVRSVVADAAEVVTIMPVGADPHDFQASAQEVDALISADALIVNGAGFEEGLLDVIEGAEDEGVPTFEAISVVDTIDFGDVDRADHGDEEGHEDHGDEDHGDEDHGDEDHDDHDHSGVDPHFFTDPVRMAEAVEGIVEFLQDEVDFADPSMVSESAEAYLDDLTELDGEVTSLVESIPEDRRILVTNHEVFGYFADRYGFELVGAVIPGGSTTDGSSAGELAELAEQVEAEGVPAIFADTSSSADVADALAAEVGDISVVDLYTESLGDTDSDGATYLQMVQTNAQRMSSALA